MTSPVTMEELEKSRLFFKSYAKVIWLSVLLPVVIGTIAILKWVTPDDYTLMGPNFAMALMSFLYAVIIHAVIVLPFSVILRKRSLFQNPVGFEPSS
jgi:flagellar motor component MotA